MILNTWWFTTYNGDCIGIIKTKDDYTDEIKYRIGIGKGKDEVQDELTILRTGDKFYPEMIK